MRWNFYSDIIPSLILRFHILVSFYRPG
jgi:hypothetical protein